VFVISNFCKGTLWDRNGDKYEGDFVNNMAEGYGIHHQVQQEFEGDSGIEIDQSVIYEGEWRADKKHGEGIETMGDGSVYEGQFRDNMRNGEGTYTFADESEYVGHWIDGKMQGKGTYHFQSGKVYEGDFWEVGFKLLKRK
jgi:hypothetical protein